MSVSRSAALVLLLAAGSALADTRVVGDELRFFSPLAPWTLALAREDWTVIQERQRDRGSFSYTVQSNRRALQFDLQIDRNALCSSDATCRDMYWNNPAPDLRNPLDVRRYQRNGFEVVQFTLQGMAGMPVRQANVSAHRYLDGHWLHVRVQKLGDRDFAPLLDVLDGMKVK